MVAIDDLSIGRRVNNATRIKGNDKFRFVEASVVDRARMLELFKGADRVFHLAALADIVPSVQNPQRYFDANVNGSYAVAEAAHATTASKSCSTPHLPRVTAFPRSIRRRRPQRSAHATPMR